VPKLVRRNPETPEGKYLVTRRDGSKPEWPYFVLGARDPAAALTLSAYANACECYGIDPEYVADVRKLVTEFEEYRIANGSGNPDGRTSVEVQS